MKKFGATLLILGFTGLVSTQPGSAETPSSPSHEDEAQLMRKAYARFQSLPFLRQEQLRILDREFQNMSEEQQAHFTRVLERYQAWLAKLPEADRKKVIEAPTPEDRLSAIKKLREQDWVNTLPKAYQDEYAKASGRRVDQLALVDKWRIEERNRQKEWEIARDHWDELHQELPSTSKDQNLMDQVDLYLTNLAAQVPPYQVATIKRLRDTPTSDRYWLWYREVVTHADKITLLPTPADWKCVSSIETLPKYIDDQIKTRKHHKEIQALPQYWPAFAAGVTTYCHFHKIKLIDQLGPCRKAQMPKEVQKAIDELSAALETAAKANDKPEVMEQARKDLNRLDKAQLQAKWPEYPQTVMELAKHYKVTVPGWSLPRPDLWDKIRKPVQTPKRDKT